MEVSSSYIIASFEALMAVMIEVVFWVVVHRARAICNQHSLPGELEFLCSTFKQNGYSDR
jgi:hypothetical protein